MWTLLDQLTIIDYVLVRQLEGLKTKLQVIVPMTERRTILSQNEQPATYNLTSFCKPGQQYPCLILARVFRNPRCADVRLS
jgi:hypothetical protein